LTRQDTALEQYRRQLNRWVAALATGDNETVRADAAERYLAGDIDLFTEGNLDKRVDILSLQLSFLAAAFEDLDELIEEYIAAQPLAAFAAGPADAAAFLRWLSASCALTPEQADHVACRQARYDVEDAARANRSGHTRFQERWSVARRLAKQLRRNDGLRLHLNPARGWATLHTRAFLDEETKLPGNVVFFALGMQIHSAVLDDPVPALLEALEEGPLTLAEWAERVGLSGPEELVAVAGRLATVGLLAFS
jgi:hypothetical protein